jgi:predicted DNA-binding protein (MmcQ/YjbR family)
MDAEDIRSYALQKADVTEGFPFGGDTLVFKVKGKLFLLMGLDSMPLRFNVKCDPERAIELREEYPDVILAGYHMNKKHWNTIVVEGLKTIMIKEMIDESYRLVGRK